MACPTCDHTMHGVGHGVFHCPRCGTLTGCYADGSASVPSLVGRVRKLIGTAKGHADTLTYPEARAFLAYLEVEGVTESVFKPEERP